MALLIPHEHGAYGQLGFPLLAVLLAGRPTLAAALLVVAFIGAFIAHEPVLVLMGQRGPRARRELAADARRTLVLYGGMTLMAGAAGLSMMHPGSRWTVAIPALFAAAAVPMIVQRTQKTAIGELHVALTLASCAVPAGIAARLAASASGAIWLVFFLGFACATLAVRGTIARQRREPSTALRVSAMLIALGSPLLAVALARALGLVEPLWTMTIPLSVLGMVLAARPPAATELRRVGWWLIGASAAEAAIAALVFRA